MPTVFASADLQSVVDALHALTDSVRGQSLDPVQRFNLIAMPCILTCSALIAYLVYRQNKLQRQHDRALALYQELMTGAHLTRARLVLSSTFCRLRKTRFTTSLPNSTLCNWTKNCKTASFQKMFDSTLGQFQTSSIRYIWRINASILRKMKRSSRVCTPGIGFISLSRTGET